MNWQRSCGKSLRGNIGKESSIVSKVLTISVAAYNVEPYIKENLDSIVASTAKDDIEVFVVDDGGKDGTYELAK